LQAGEAAQPHILLAVPEVVHDQAGGRNSSLRAWRRVAARMR
jgi:hypothetical protein